MWGSEDRLDIGLNMGPDLLALRAVEVLADVHLPVELQHRLRVGLEDLHSVPHRLRLVVLSLDQRLPGLVVLPLDLRQVRLEDNDRDDEDMTLGGLNTRL